VLGGTFFVLLPSLREELFPTVNVDAAGPRPDAVRWSTPQLGLIGMTAIEALTTITSGAASALGLGHRKGHLAAGYDADVLAIDGDPLTDPAALHAIRAVYVRGTAIRG